MKDMSKYLIQTLRQVSNMRFMRRYFKSALFGVIFFTLLLSSAAAAINTVITPSRTTGVAPLSVFFDATDTTGLTDNGFFSDNAAYMDATFAWDFDADNTDPGGKYKNASGFIAGHVFEKPGTYRVHLDVYDADGETAAQDVTITVLPFTGTTYYVASNGSDSNTGRTMGEPFSSIRHALTGSHVAPNTRILFRKGDTFYTDTCIYVNGNEGPVIIGSYEDPENPSTINPILHSTSVDSAWAVLHFYDANDWRIMDLVVRAGGPYSYDPRYPSGIGWNSQTSNTLKYRVEEYNLGDLALSPYGTYNTIAECDFHDISDTGYTSNSGGPNDGATLIGNWVHEKNVVDTHNKEHIFRLQGGSRYFIAHNTFGPNVIVNYDGLTIRGNSEKVVIYKNTITDWVTDFRPQNKDSAEEYQHHGIIDSNLFIGQDHNMANISLVAKDIVVRNNIHYNYRYGIGVGDDTVVGPSQRIKIYNNTFINPTAGTNYNPIYVDNVCTNIEIKNNLMLDTAGSKVSQTFFLEIRDGSVLNGESNNNLLWGPGWSASGTNLFDGQTLDNWQAVSTNDINSLVEDPRLLSTDYTEADFCKPQAESPVVNRGEFTPNALDYYGNLRDDSRDIGACEYICGSCACEGDRDEDDDVDGADLSVFSSQLGDVGSFASEFGRTGCRN